MVYRTLWVLPRRDFAVQWYEKLGSPEDEKCIIPAEPLCGLGAKIIILLDWEPGRSKSVMLNDMENYWVENTLRCRLTPGGVILIAERRTYPEISATTAVLQSDNIGRSN